MKLKSVITVIVAFLVEVWLVHAQQTLNHRVRRISPNGTIDTVVANGRKGFGGDGGPALAAMLYYPAGLAIDKQGNLFIADMDNNRVRRVDHSGITTTVAGSGKEGSGGDGRGQGEPG